MIGDRPQFPQASIETPGGYGAFVTACVSVGLCTAVVIAVEAGLPLTLAVFFAGVIPVITVAVILVAVSMAWIFIEIGRHHRRPKWMMMTAILIAIALAQVLVIVAQSAAAKMP